MRSYFDGMLRYFEISGRSTRMQYWMFALIQLLLTVGAVAIDYQTGGFRDLGNPQPTATLFIGIVHIVPAFTLTIRRLHDVGRSGWWYFLPLVPIVGAIILLVWMCWPSDEYANAYGDHPRNAGPAPAPRYRRPQHSTIPRQVRMGSNAARPPSVGYDGLAAPDRFI